MTITADRQEHAADIVLIGNLLARLAVLADEGDIDAYAACFSVDAVWRMPAIAATGVEASELLGREAIAAAARTRRARGIQGPGTRSRHVVTGSVISVEGDHARATSYFRFYTETTGEPRLATMGTYADRFRRVEGRWLLMERTVGVG